MALSEGRPTGHGRLSLGCSIGTAIIPGDGCGIDAGVLHADAELYRVKRQQQRQPLDLMRLGDTAQGDAGAHAFGALRYTQEAPVRSGGSTQVYGVILVPSRVGRK